MSNIDKHRRLILATWWSDLVYWGSDEPSKRKWRWGALPFEDGDILGTLIDDPSHPEPLPLVQSDIELRIIDPLGASSADIASLLRNMHGHIVYRVLPQIF
jgi:hypothetical protein